MNHIYRVVWRSALGTCVAVSETARGRGKSGRAAAPVRRGVPALAALVFGLGAAPFAVAQTATLAAGSTGRTYVNPNGATIVDIAGANGAGLSHNRYTQFNVDAKGLVLNNTTSSSGAMFQQSQLAGQVKSNDYSARAASVILNEVVSSNRSQLAGFAEVLGSKADVVLVNPYGITCGGCGFINTDRVTLSTGLPNFNANGGLAGFTVNQGDILITGNGLNGTAQQILDLVSRSVRIDGNINAQDLGVFAGAQQWRYDTRGVTGAAAPQGSAPVYAIDSSALGGMYANRIRLVSTDAGVGVRMLGNAAANGQDFSLSAAGRIELNNAISAQRDILLASTSNDAAALALTDAALTSGRDTKLDARQGGLAMQRTRVIAGGALGVNTAGNAGFDASTLAAGSMSIASQGALNLGNSGVQASGDIRLASGGATTVGAGGAQAVQSTGGRIDIEAAGGLVNDGAISADAGAVGIRAGQQLANNGTINAGTDLGVADAKGGATQAIDNRGTLIAGQGADVRGAAVVNSGWMQAGTDAAVAADSLNNGGNIVALGGNVQLRVDGTLTNTGKVQAAKDIALSARSGAQAVRLDNRSEMRALGAMQLAAATVDNGGVLVSGTSTRIDSKTLTNQGDVYTDGALKLNADVLDNHAKLLSAGSLEVQAGTITNRQDARIEAASASQVQADSVVNEGAWLLSQQGGARDSMAVTGVLDNRGTLQSGGAATLQAAQVKNSGVLTGTTNLSVRGASIENTGTLQSLGAMNLAVGSGGLTNTSNGEEGSGTILAQGDLGIESAQGDAYTAKLGGTVQSGGLLKVSGPGATAIDLSGNASGRTVDVDVTQLSIGASSALASTGNLDIAADQLELKVEGTGSSARTGRVLAATGGTGTGNITLGGNLVNNGLLFSGADLNVRAPNITVGGTGAISALGSLVVHANAGTLDLTAGAPTAGAGNLVNNGLLFARNGDLVAKANGTLTNNADINSTAAKDSAYGMRLTANTLVNNNVINGSNDIRIVAATLRNEVEGGDTRYIERGPNSPTREVDYRNDGRTAGENTDEAWLYEYTYTETQKYRSALPSTVPQITAGRNMTLAFNKGSNLAAVISAVGTLDMVGFSYDPAQTDGAAQAQWGIQDDIGHGFRLSGGSFVNDNLALKTITYTVRWSETTKWVGWNTAGASTYYDHRLCSRGGTWDSVCFVDGYQTTPGAPATTQPANAGLYGAGLKGTGFTLRNNGASWSAGTDTNLTAARRAAAPADTRDASSTSGQSGPAGAPGVGTTGSVGYTGGNAGNGVSGTSFGGIKVTLPNSPNSYYVLSSDPKARYLVETNPLYLGGGSTLGSDYLARLLGYNPDELAMRLGDASYEAWLVKQQLIAQTGNAVLVGYQSADGQMKSLMEHAAGESTSLGLAYGKPLTPEQQAALKQDIVWMVQTEIEGKTVLAPVVYLAQSTKANISKGAVISAENANLSLESMTNTGGTIVGTKSLLIASTGDISNLSGLIKGGNVSLGSTEGSIVNKTLSEGGGGSNFYSTQVANTAGIQSTGSLALDAKKDITNVGANVSAGGDASLKAGNNITFDTIEKKDTQTTYGKEEVKNGSSFSTTTTTTTNQVKSGLTAGGDLKASAGNDITLAGTDTKVSGNADLNAGNNLNIVARENSSVTHSESHAAGWGMNDSVFGKTTTATDSTSIRNVGSNFEVGGNAGLGAKNDVTVQGSNVNVAGNGAINATNVNVLAGRNYDETTSTTTRSGVLQVSSGNGQSSASGSNSDSSSGRGRAAASADASAEASGQGSGGLAFKSTTTTETQATDLQHVGSTLTFGKDLDVKASQDMNLQGSAVNARGHVNVDARNVNLLAAQDVHTSTTTVTTTTVGLMASSDNKAGAQAGASANAAGGQGNPGAGANASAGAQASSENRVDVFQRQQDTTETLDVTNRGSAINAGGQLNVKARDTLTLQGSDMSSGGSMNLNANNMRFEAVQDVHETRTSSERTTAGLYASGNAEVSAQGGGKVGMGAQGGASAGASASGEVGVYGSNTRSSSVEGATTARTSSLKSGGDISRTAADNITDVGTRIDGSGNLNQSARNIDSFAAANTTYSSADSTTHTAKLGAYAEGAATASAQVQPAPGVQGKGKGVMTGKGAGVGAGVRASYEYEGSSESAGSSQAVVSSIRMGGSVNSQSSGKTTMEGTQIEAGRDVNLSASSLDYRAAANTSSADSQRKSVNATVSVDLANQGGSVDAGYAGDKSSDRSSTAVVGGIKAGGNLNLQTRGDMRLEGTNLSAGQGASIDAGGKLDFAAARNTASGSSESLAVDASVSAGRGGGSGNASANSAKSNYSLDQDVAGSVSAGKGPVSIRSGGNASFTGTAIASKEGNVSVAAGGDVTMKAARTVEHRESTQVGVSANGLADNNANGQSFNAASGATSPGGSGGSGAKTKVDRRAGGAELGVGTGKADSDTASVGLISSGSGTVSISSGRNTSLEGTQVSAAQGIAVNTGGSFERKDAVSTSSASNSNFSAMGSANTQTPTGKAGAAKGSKAGSTPAGQNGGNAGGTGIGTGAGTAAPASGATGQAAAKPSAKDKGVQLGAARQLPGNAAPASKPAGGATRAGSAAAGNATPNPTPAANATPAAGNATAGATTSAKRGNIQLGSNRASGAAPPAAGGSASTPAKPATASASAPADANSPADGNTGWTSAKPIAPSTTGVSAWQAAKPTAGSTPAASSKTTAKKPPPNPYAYQGGTGVADVYVDEQSNRSSQGVKLDGGSGGIVINQGVSPAAQQAPQPVPQPAPAAAAPSAANPAKAAMKEKAAALEQQADELAVQFKRMKTDEPRAAQASAPREKGSAKEDAAAVAAKLEQMKAKAGESQQAKTAQVRQAQAEAEAEKQAQAKQRASEKAAEDAAAQTQAMTQLLEARKRAAEQAR